MSAHAIQIPTEQSRGDGQWIIQVHLHFSRVNLAPNNGLKSISLSNLIKKNVQSNCDWAIANEAMRIHRVNVVRSIKLKINRTEQRIKVNLLFSKPNSYVKYKEEKSNNETYVIPIAWVWKVVDTYICKQTNYYRK